MIVISTQQPVARDLRNLMGVLWLVDVAPAAQPDVRPNVVANIVFRETGQVVEL